MMNGKIDYNKTGFSRALYFAMTLKGVYHPDDYIREKLEIDNADNPETEIRKGTRKPTDRHSRWRGTRGHEIHMDEIRKYAHVVISEKTRNVKHVGKESSDKGDKIYTCKTRTAGKKVCREFQEKKPDFFAYDNKGNLYPYYWDESKGNFFSYDESPWDDEPEDLGGHWDVDLQEFISEREIPVPVEMPDDPGYQAYIIHMLGGAWEDRYDIQYVVLSWDKCCRKVKELYEKVEHNKEEYYDDDACLYICPAKIEDDEVVRVKDVPWIVDHRFFPLES